MIRNLIAQAKTLWEKGFFHLAVSNYSVQFIVFASHLLIAKIMSPDDVGVIKSIETFMSIAIVLGGGGAIFAILKLIPENKDLKIRSFLLSYSIRYTIYYSVGVFLLFCLLTYLGLLSNDSKHDNWFYLYALAIVPSVLTQTLIRYYQSIDFFKRISTVILYLKSVSAAIVLGFTYYFFINGYIISTIITSTLSLLILIIDLRKDLFSKSEETFDSIKKYFNSLSNAGFISQIGDQLKINAPFLIAYWLLVDKVEFGLYAFAWILVQGMNVLVSSVQQFLIPKMSEISGNMDLFLEKLKTFERKFNLFSILLFLIAQLIIPLLISLVFGDEYEDSILLFRIMMVGWLIQGFYSLKVVVFLSLGKMQYTFYYSVLIVVIATPLIYFLTLKFGSVGASIGFVAQNIVTYFLVIHFTKKALKSINLLNKNKVD